MLITTDIHQSPARIFVRSLLRGISAPAYVYHVQDAPPIPQTIMVQAPSVQAGNALAADWRAIGLDFDTVIAQHGQAASTQP